MTATTHQALYRRWRAQTFGEIVGQDAVVETLRNAVRTDRVAHAILFTGPRGTGKTSLARILAKALNCTDRRPDGDPCDRCPSCVAIREGTALDVVEIDAASNRGINEVRELRERLAYTPAQLRRKVYILDEAHQITRDAWNALLKSLEEPPEFVTFMFASTHPQEFPPAILSRLQRYDVRRLTVPEIVGKLTRILEADGREAEPEAVELIGRLAAGGMRDAESILDQLLSASGGRIEAAAVRELLGLADAESVLAFVEALAAGDAGRGLTVLDGLEERGRDLRVFLDQLVDALRERLLGEMARPDAVRQPGLVAAARRFAGIDPTRLGPGGMRLQLELALLESPPSPESVPVAEAMLATPAPRPAPARRHAPETDAPTAEPAPAQAPPAIAPEPPAAEPPAPEPAPPAAAEPPAAEPPAAEPPAAEPPAAEPPAAAAEPPATPEPAAPAASAGTEAPVDTTTIPIGSPSPDLDRLREGWASIVASVRPATRAVIAECRPMSVEGATVTLGFPESRGFLKEHAERRRADLEAAVGGFLGRPVNVRAVATNLDLVPPLPGDDEAADILAEARRIFADDLAGVPEVE